MAGTESLRQVAQARAPWSAWFGIVLLFLFFGVIVLAIIGPSPRRSDYEESRAKKRMENLKTLREETDKALTTYGWIDKNKGVAHIPIERAMELTVADLAKQKPAPAGPIATPASAEATAGKPEAQATVGAAASPVSASPAPAGSPQPGGASPGKSPSAQAPISPSPAAQASPPTSASPSPTKSP
jgi:hypothetical protein